MHTLQGAIVGERWSPKKLLIKVSRRRSINISYSRGARAVTFVSSLLPNYNTLFWCLKIKVALKSNNSKIYATFIIHWYLTRCWHALFIYKHGRWRHAHHGQAKNSSGLRRSSRQMSSQQQWQQQQQQQEQVVATCSSFARCWQHWIGLDVSKL